MRLRLTLKLVAGTTLPCNYMYELSSCLYKVLNEGNPVFADWLHNKGFCKERKVFKLFTFSNFHIPRFKIIGDRLLVLSDTARLVVSFYPIEAIEAFVMGVFKDRQLEIGDRKSKIVFEVAAIERIAEPVFGTKMYSLLIDFMFVLVNFIK